MFQIKKNVMNFKEHKWISLWSKIQYQKSRFKRRKRNNTYSSVIYYVLQQLSNPNTYKVVYVWLENRTLPVLNKQTL